MIRVGVLGSTGSIGTQTLAVCRHLPDVKVVAIGAGTNISLLREQINEFEPKLAAVGTKELAASLRAEVNTTVSYGEEGLTEIATHPDVDLLVVSVVGAVGLRPTLQALKAGKRVALANKETLVIGGHLVMEYREQLIPIDSEHNALWQCLDGKDKDDVSELILTASGGPFYRYPDSLAEVTVKQALNHPNWEMGGKITIDSATMMNKGLEVIEAHWLFGFGYQDIKVIIHPQSIIHSLVRFTDGSLLAQMATTDMRLPIQYALTYPELRPSQVKELQLETLSSLSFHPPDNERFPCLSLAYQAGTAGGSMPIMLNGANEIAVEKFLRGEIGFMDIPAIVEKVLAGHTVINNPDLPTILELDKQAREQALAQVQCRKKG